LEDFEGKPEKKLFKYFRMGGALKEDFLEDVAEMHDDIKEITLKDGSKITHDELMEAHQFLEPDETQEYYASMQYAKGGEIGNEEILSKEDVKKLYDRYKYLENLDEQRGGNTGFKNQYKNVINEIEDKYVKKIIENSKYEDLKKMYDKKLNFQRFSKNKKLGLKLITFSKYWMNSGGWKTERLSNEEKDKAIKELKKLFPKIIIEKPTINSVEYSYGVESYEYINMIIDFDKYGDGGMMAKGGTFESKVESISKKLVGKPVPKQFRKEYGSKYDKQDADEAARRIVGNMRKLYGE
jgi:hypothetical protein